MNWAILTEGVVTSIQESEEIPEAMAGQMVVDITGADCQLGWVLSGNKIEERKIVIPDVTPRQFRQAVILSGMSIASIEAAINAQSEPLKSLAMIEWEYSMAFKRNNPLVNQMAPYIGVTSEQLDNLWLLAGTL